jgi:hypothetical protein
MKDIINNEFYTPLLLCEFIRKFTISVIEVLRCRQYNVQLRNRAFLPAIEVLTLIIFVLTKGNPPFRIRYKN